MVEPMAHVVHAQHIVKQYVDGAFTADRRHEPGAARKPDRRLCSVVSGCGKTTMLRLISGLEYPPDDLLGDPAPTAA